MSSQTAPITKDFTLPQYNKNLLDDGPEFYWIKRILERDNDQIYLLDRGMALYCIATFAWHTVDNLLTSTHYAGDRIAAWNAFLNGDRSLIRKEIEDHTTGQELMSAIGQQEQRDPAVRLR